MRHRTILSLIAFAAVAACQPPKPAALSQADIDAIKANDAAFAKAANAGDLVAITAMYTSDATVLPPMMPMAEGSAAIKQLFGGMLHVMTPNLVLTPKAVEGEGDRATLIGTYHLASTLKAGNIAEPPEDGKYIEVVRRQADGSWKMTHDAWSPDAPAPAAVPNVEYKKKN